ncbi:MAG: 16S rRNA (cytosine(1402)-N(4))-methyltransferase RsmH [Candidatus Omnitrophota bacterium]
MGVSMVADNMNEHKQHIPVMDRTVQHMLDLKEGDIVLDGTLGMGGHASSSAQRIGSSGRLIGLDRDRQALEIAAENLAVCPCRKDLRHSDFRYLDEVLDELHIPAVDAILLDLGVSSVQLDDAARGFSFRENGPLDMRMDREHFISAYDLVNSLSERELSTILQKYGEERFHDRIAHFVIEQRSRHPIETTRELGELVARAIPGRGRRYKIHPATRTFQALRIAVNRELESLDIALEKGLQRLKTRGRMCVIAFHSLEDRIVKHTFRKWAKEGQVQLLTKKPLRPDDQEISENKRARSARVRCIERKASF